MVVQRTPSPGGAPPFAAPFGGPPDDSPPVEGESGVELDTESTTSSNVDGEQGVRYFSHLQHPAVVVSDTRGGTRTRDGGGNIGGAATWESLKDEFFKLQSEEQVLRTVIKENRRLEDDLEFYKDRTKTLLEKEKTLMISAMESGTKAEAFEAARDRVAGEHGRKLFRLERHLGKLKWENKTLKTELVVAQQHVFEQQEIFELQMTRVEDSQKQEQQVHSQLEQQISIKESEKTQLAGQVKLLQENLYTLGKSMKKETGALEKALEERRKEIDSVLVEKDRCVMEKEQVLAEKNAALAEKDRALTEKDSVIAGKDNALAAKEQELDEVRRDGEEKVASLQQQLQQVMQREEAAAEAASERERSLLESMSQLRQELGSEKERALSELQQRLESQLEQLKTEKETAQTEIVAVRGELEESKSAVEQSEQERASLRSEG
ncbi:unnamed protein product [Amoebophrya sp. A25]|nr:unnamed protein product [Amoebophrya sp. A25]|eukprot:GSA25T00017089001.1